jgi:inosine/xanthosine triphosphate pyrophosphatase family protein
VENIFHYSFLVKKGTGAIALRDEKGLHIEGIQTKPGLKIKYVSEDKMAPVARQGILSLTMQDWRALCEAYQVEEGGLPHRKVHKEAFANSLSQASGISSSQ